MKLSEDDPKRPLIGEKTMEEKDLIHKYHSLGEPCRNFCIFGSIVIRDPKDGREKMVLSNLVHAGVGTLIFIDPETGAGETIKSIDDDGAWALHNLDDRKLLVGTCGRYGYLLCLDLETRKWMEPLKDPGERYIWNLARGSDGKIYGGTWPGCVLLRYDPGTHTLENLGRASQRPGNRYSRMVYGGAPGYILINCCFDDTHVSVYDIARGNFFEVGRDGFSVKEATEDFICLSNGEELEFYSPVSFEPIEPETYLPRLAQKDGRLKEGMVWDVRLENGTMAGVRGQEYFLYRKESNEPVLKPIPSEAPATGIMTVIPGPDGMLWGATSLGQTIFRYNPATGEYWNSNAVCNNGGEVYGMAFVGSRLFISAYAGGDHVVYDMKKPWDQYHNINPITLKSAAPKLVRPTGRSIIGPDGNFWTGWSAAYGVYGGGLTRVDTDSLEMTMWYDPIPGQSVAGIACDDEYIYYTTNGFASGLDRKTEPFYLAAWSPQGRLVGKVRFDSGPDVAAVGVTGGYVIAGVGQELRIFRTKSLEYVGSICTGALCTCLVGWRDGTMAAFCGKDLSIVDPETLAKRFITKLPGPVATAAVTEGGKLCFAHKTELFVIE